MGRKTYNETPTRRRKAKVRARIHASVLPVLSEDEAAHRIEMVKSKKERRKRKEKEANPISQFPGCRDDNPAPSIRARGMLQRKSVFLRFMCGDFTLLITYNWQRLFRT